jgi:hypothetical protein
MPLSYQEIKAIVDKLIGEGMKEMGSSQEELSSSPKNITKTSYPNLPLLDPPPPPDLLPYKNAALKLKYLTDLNTAKAVFAIMWAEASKDRPSDSFRSAGGHNYAGVQTDSGKWSSGGITARYRRNDSERSREFAVFPDDNGFLNFMINRIKGKNINGGDGDSWTISYINKWWSPSQKSSYIKGTEKYNQKLAIYNTAIKKFNEYTE